MPTRQWSPEELIAMGVSAPRAFDPPGSAYSYSTTNTVLLGRIIQNVTGQSYEHNLQTRMLEPLGLHHSGLANSLPAPYAHGFSSCAGGASPKTRRRGPGPGDGPEAACTARSPTFTR